VLPHLQVPHQHHPDYQYEFALCHRARIGEMNEAEQHGDEAGEGRGEEEGLEGLVDYGDGACRKALLYELVDGS
jgi:hypothetical protein